MSQESKIPRQKIWPLFVVSLLLMTFGFYFAFYQPRELRQDTRPTLEELAVQLILPDGLETVGPPVLLSWSDTERNYSFDIQSMITQDEAARPLITRIAMNFRDVPVEVPEESQIAFRRTYHDVRIQVRDGEKRVGQDITRDVERLVETAAHKMVYERTGKFISWELVSSEAAQLSQTLEIIRDSWSTLALQFPRESVNVGESWEYEAPAHAEDEDGLTSWTGGTVFETRLEGFINRDGRQHAVLSQTITTHHQADTRVDEESEAIQARYEGRGQGLSYFDMEKGSVHEASVRLDATMKSQDAESQARYRLRLTRVD